MRVSGLLPVITVVACLSPFTSTAQTTAQRRAAASAAAEEQTEPYRKHRDTRHGHDHYYPDRGAIVRDLPVGTIGTSYAGVSYRYHDGIWLEPRGPAYMVVSPPLGLIAPTLPLYSTVVTHGSESFLYCNDTYYRPRPDLGGYEVVNDPAMEAGAAPAAPEALVGGQMPAAVAPNGGTAASAAGGGVGFAGAGFVSGSPGAGGAVPGAGMVAGSGAPGGAPMGSSVGAALGAGSGATLGAGVGAGGGVALATRLSGGMGPGVGAAAVPVVAREGNFPRDASIPREASPPRETSLPRDAGPVREASPVREAALLGGAMPGVGAAAASVPAPSLGAGTSAPVGTAGLGAVPVAVGGATAGVGVAPAAVGPGSAAVGPGSAAVGPGSAAVGPGSVAVGPGSVAAGLGPAAVATTGQGPAVSPVATTGPGLAGGGSPVATTGPGPAVSPAATTGPGPAGGGLSAAAVGPGPAAVGSAAAGGGTPKVPKVFLYPRNGQSADQQARDRYDCYRFGVSQSGFDPMRTGANPPPPGSEPQSDFERAQSACFEGRGYSNR